MELRFEAWNTELKVMHRVGDDYGTTSHLDCINYLKQGQPVIIRQWTGLTDKNGKDIYEGDIINMWYAPQATAKGAVSFVKGSFVFRTEEAVPSQCPLSSIEEFGNYIEVIGNIHQHPELMDRGNNND